MMLTSARNRDILPRARENAYINRMPHKFEFTSVIYDALAREFDTKNRIKSYFLGPG